MAIKKIRISNFKSFKDLEVELGNFNVLIGANASGKSNFIQVFKFLRDITNYGLDNALSMQGGIEYLRNVGIGSSKNFSLEVVSVLEPELKFGRKNMIGGKLYETIYKIDMKFKTKGLGFDISEDKLTLKYKYVQLEKQKLNEKKFDEKETLGQGEIVFSNVNGKVERNIKMLSGGLREEDIPLLPIFPEDEKLPPKTLLLQTLFGVIPTLGAGRGFSEISIYDFDPKLPKRASPITGKADLEEDGNNLALVLKHVIENKDWKRKFSNLIKDLLPFIEDLDIEKFADKSLLFKLQEIYFKNRYLPASLISDGTVNITALIIALYFEKKPLIIIEEPERNIHPSLISKVMEMMKEVSKDKQVVVTTHNPEVVRYAGKENILLVSRDKNGFSIISRPADKEEVKTFLKNEIGIEELYVQDLLGV